MEKKQTPNVASPTFLRYALGLVYFHFGILKFFPDLSPAEMLATQTVMSMTQHWMDASTALWCLAVLECAIGLGFIFNVLPRVTFVLFIGHMIGTFMPLFVLTEFTFKFAPFAPNVEGQYIFKNIVFLAAGWTVLLPNVFPRRVPRLVSTANTDESISKPANGAPMTDKRKVPSLRLQGHSLPV